MADPKGNRMKPIDFWYSIGSTYTYLTVLRLADYAAKHQIKVNWRPFNVRAIMIAQKNIPFANKPDKSAYMWRDIERRAALYGLSPKLPAPYPLDDLALANQVALLGHRHGWGQAYTVEAYRLWFEDGLPAGSEPNLSRAISHADQNPADALQVAKSPEIVDALRSETELCQAAGVFGAPSFTVDSEVFWGDDRLDDAVSWRKYGTLAV